MNPATKRRMVTAHARYSHHCTCGTVVNGNGGNAQHKRMHERRADGHHGISQAEFDKRFPLYDRCRIAGCMYRQLFGPTKDGGFCEQHWEANKHLYAPTLYPAPKAQP